MLLGPLVYALSLPGPRLTVPVVALAGPDAITPDLELEVDVAHEVVEQVEVEPVEVEPTVEVEPAVEAEPEPDSSRIEFAFVDHTGVVLDRLDQDDGETADTWTRGRLFEPRGRAPFRVAKRVHPRDAPERYWSQRGRTFDLYGTEGKICSARIDELLVVAQWEGSSMYDLGVEDDEPDPEAHRETLWAEAEHWVVGKLVKGGDCPRKLDEVVWARDAELPAPRILVPEVVDNPVADARARAFQASPALADLERDYRRYYAELDAESREWEDSWETIVEQYPLTVTTWAEAGEPRLLEVEFGADYETCGDGFDSRIATLERVTADGTVEHELPVDPVTVVDIDLDGQWEAVYSDWGSRTLYGADLDVVAEFEIGEDWTCPC